MHMHNTYPDDKDAWLLREPDGTALGRYTPPAAESAKIDARLSTLVVVQRDVAVVDPVTYACVLSNIDAVVVAVVVAGHILL